MQSLAKVLCTSGLAAEAKIARAAGFSVVLGAGDRDRTRALVERVAADTDCLVSFGIAGGLAPNLEPGTVIVSGVVVSNDRHWLVAARYRRQLSGFARALGAIEGPVLGATAIVATRAEKQRAWAKTGAVAVDLESEIVADTATTLGIPFIVLRAIADSAHRDLPPAALIPLRTDGTPQFHRVFAEVLRRPFQISEIVALAQETRTALSALIGPARALRGMVDTA
jgi:hopanoid-associated phosphorylase